MTRQQRRERVREALANHRWSRRAFMHPNRFMRQWWRMMDSAWRTDQRRAQEAWERDVMDAWEWADD